MAKSAQTTALTKTIVKEPVPRDPSASASASTRASASALSAATATVPAYLQETYRWAYLDARNAKVLDREWVVSLILWGQHRRLQRAAFAEIAPGAKVLLPAHVYGDFTPSLARHIGPEGQLDVSDISPTQIALCRQKTARMPWVTVRRADARCPDGGQYDVVCCYFLLHELPDAVKTDVVDALLRCVAPGGKVVFVDYHKPHWAHPMRPVISAVFRWLEPFARVMWKREIWEFASEAERLVWRKETAFGGLYQKVVAVRR